MKIKPDKYLYLFINRKEGYILLSGIQFDILFNSIKESAKHLLFIEPGLLEEGFSGFDHHVMFEYSNKDAFCSLMHDSFHSTETYTFIDFESLNRLRELSEIDMAEMLYFSKYCKLISGNFLKKMKSEFAIKSFDGGVIYKVFYSKDRWAEDLVDEIVSKCFPGIESNCISNMENGILVKYETEKPTDQNLVIKSNVGEVMDVDEIL